MARISGLILSIGLLVVISSLASPASAWDGDDDDGRRFRHRHFDSDDDDGYRYGRGLFDGDDDDAFFRHRHRGFRYGGGPAFGPGFRQPIFPRRHFYRGYQSPYYPPAQSRPYYPPARREPYYPPVQEQPIVPEPLPPEAYDPGGDDPSQQQEPILVPPAQQAGTPAHERPGQFVDAAVPLYPRVRVKDADHIPGHGVHKVLAVRSPDPFRFPGCVYVQVCVPPGPCRDVKVEDGGGKIELDYGEVEVEVKSSRGVVTVEYDD